MIILSTTTQETNAAQNARVFAHRYQPVARLSVVRFDGMTEQMNPQNFDISRYWEGRDYRDWTEQASRKVDAA